MAISDEPMLTIGLVVLFWSSLVVLLYSYAGYPVLVWLAAKFYPHVDHSAVACDRERLPPVTVLIAAHNAEHHIGERIKNVLACDYPADRLKILIASDGSTDATVQLVEAFGNPHVRVLAYAKRRGKTSTLVDAVQHVDSEIVLFTDATNHFDRNSIRQLVRHFADPNVGIATGRVSLVDEQGQPVESMYWDLEMLIRQSEIRLGVMLGANGPIYAIRHRFFVAPKYPVINDDFVLPILAHLRYGCGIVYDQTARAYMLSSGGLIGEFQRRCRIGAGAYQSLVALSELFRPRHAKQLVAFASHKLLRWIGPFLLLILLVTSGFLSSVPRYQTLFWAQSAAYFLSVFGLFVPNRGFAARLARIAASFLVLNLALLAGFFRWIAQPKNVTWSPTVRPALDKILTPMQREISGSPGVIAGHYQR